MWEGTLQYSGCYTKETSHKYAVVFFIRDLSATTTPRPALRVRPLPVTSSQRPSPRPILTASAAA